MIREAHDGSIVSLHFFANEPILMSSAADNSIKVSAILLSLFHIIGDDGHNSGAYSC